MDHPNIVNWKECFEDERYLFIVMDCINGAQELHQIIVKRIKEVEADPSK